MYCSVLSATVSGMEMIPVQVEADVSDGMPQFTMVGADSSQKHGNFPAAETNYD